MENKIAVIGTHIQSFKDIEEVIVVDEQPNSLPYTTFEITNPYKDLIEPSILKDGKTLRRERRKQQRSKK